MNWYIEEQTGNPTAPAALLPTPGYRVISTAADGVGARAHFAQDGREWAIESDTLYEITSAGTWLTVNKGLVLLDSKPATISSNGDGGGQLFITSGNNGYILDIATNSLSQVTALDGLCTMGAHMDGYFIALDAATSTVYTSELYDGLTWNTGTAFAERSAASDPWVSMWVLNGAYLWLFGTETSEIWYNEGTLPFPFAPHPSGRGVPYGIAAPFSASEIQGRLFWLGRTATGSGMVLSTSGFSPERISTPTVELAIQSVAADEATADAYDQAGHTFYMLQFPRSSSWCYDATSGQWHERGTWDGALGDFTRTRARFHAFAFGRHRWLDLESGDLYLADINLGTDIDDIPLRRLRRAPALTFQNQRIYYAALELQLDVGLGVVPPAQGSDPQVQMRYSNDAGRNWGPWAMRTCGATGEFAQRVRWNRCGAGRKRVFEVAVSDPTPWRLVDAFLELGQRPSGMSQAQAVAWEG